MIREFYLKNRNNRSLFPITIKLGEEIPVDSVTLAKKSPFLLKLIEDLGENSIDMSKINPGVDDNMLRKIILSWYDCEPFPDESFELLHCVDWLGDQGSKKRCMIKLAGDLNNINSMYRESEKMKYIENACRYNCDEIVDKFIDDKISYATWPDELIDLLKRYNYWGRYQLKFVKCFNYNRPFEECLTKLTHPLIYNEKSRLQEALIALFFGNGSFSPNSVGTVIERVVKAHQIVESKITITSIHPEILELLKSGLREKLGSYDDVKEYPDVN